MHLTPLVNAELSESKSIEPQNDSVVYTQMEEIALAVMDIIQFS